MFVRLLIILIIAAVAAAVLYGLNPYGGETSLKMPKLGIPEIPGLAKEEAEEKKAGTTTVYKWQDKNGEWHFSNQPPAEGVASKVITYRSDTNVIQSTKAPAKPEPASEPETPTANPLLPITNPEKVKKLMDDAKNIEKLLQDRQEQMDQRVEKD